MEFSPSNPIVKLCLQGMTMEDEGKPDEAEKLFLHAWNESINDFEKYLSAHYIARHQKTTPDQLGWLQTALTFALKINDDGVKSALPALYTNIAKGYENLSDDAQAKLNYTLASSFSGKIADQGPFYHGTKADLPPGDFLMPGLGSNYKDDIIMNHIYFTALMNGAGLAAALAKGDGRERIYIVEPTGSFEHDPNVTDKKFPGNPTRSYRTTAPLKIIGEATDWVRTSPEEVQKWKERLAKSTGEIIN